jgi:hypothetical protein
MVSKNRGNTVIPFIPANVGWPRGGPRNRGIGAPTRATPVPSERRRGDGDPGRLPSASRARPRHAPSHAKSQTAASSTSLSPKISFPAQSCASRSKISSRARSSCLDPDTAATNVSVIDDNKIVTRVSGLDELFSVTIKEDVVLFDLCANEKEEKSLDVHVLKENNYMQEEELNQDVTYACHNDQARFDKETKTPTFSNFWKANGAYVDTWEYGICDLFDSANKIRERNLFLFLPLPRKRKTAQSSKTWRLLRDLLSLKDTGWGPPPILIWLLDYHICRDVKGNLIRDKSLTCLRTLLLLFVGQVKGVGYILV